MPLDHEIVVRLARVSEVLTESDWGRTLARFGQVMPGMEFIEVGIGDGHEHGRRTFSGASFAYGYVGDDLYFAVEGLKNWRQIVAAIFESVHLIDLGNSIRCSRYLWEYTAQANVAFESRIRRQPRSVTMWGHSAGGATVLIYGALLGAMNYTGPVNIVTFGAPKPMTEGGVAQVSVYSQQNYRNGNDPIPDFPPATRLHESLLLGLAAQMAVPFAGPVAVGALTARWNEYQQVPRIQLGRQSPYEELRADLIDHEMVNYLTNLQREEGGSNMPALTRADVEGYKAYATALWEAYRVEAARDYLDRYLRARPTYTGTMAILDAGVGRDALVVADELDTFAATRSAVPASTFQLPVDRFDRIPLAVAESIRRDFPRYVSDVGAGSTGGGGNFETFANGAMQQIGALGIAHAEGLRLAAAPGVSLPVTATLSGVPLNEAGYQAERMRLLAEIARLQTEVNTLRSRMMGSQPGAQVPAAPGFAPAVPPATPNAVPAPSSAAPGFAPATPSYAPPIDPNNPFRRY